MMNSRVLLLATVAVTCAAASAQGTDDRELARLLANDGTRQGAVAKIVALGSSRIPLLMTWIRKVPAGVDQYGLYIGLADVFRQLKTKEAISFLIKNIGLCRTRNVDLNPWEKTAGVIEETFPAAAALIHIGPEAAVALIRASERPMQDDERLVGIFVVSQVKGVPEARAFLTAVRGQASTELYYANEGLKMFQGK